MKRVSMYMGVMAVALSFSVVPGQAQNKDKDKNTADRTANMGGMGQDRVTREVRHELVMLPYYGVFDNLAYRVDGGTVRLYGQVTRPTLKSDAENVVKGIEGVTRVDNRSRFCRSLRWTMESASPRIAPFSASLASTVMPCRPFHRFTS